MPNHTPTTTRLDTPTFWAVTVTYLVIGTMYLLDELSPDQLAATSMTMAAAAAGTMTLQRAIDRTLTLMIEPPPAHDQQC